MYFFHRTVSLMLFNFQGAFRTVSFQTVELDFITSLCDCQELFSRPPPLSQAATFISYHTQLCLSRTFFVPDISSSVYDDRMLFYHIHLRLSRTFCDFFRGLSTSTLFTAAVADSFYIIPLDMVFVNGFFDIFLYFFRINIPCKICQVNIPYLVFYYIYIDN